MDAEEGRRWYGEKAQSERSDIAVLQLQRVDHMERGYVVDWLTFGYN